MHSRLDPIVPTVVAVARLAVHADHTVALRSDARCAVGRRSVPAGTPEPNNWVVAATRAIPSVAIQTVSGAALDGPRGVRLRQARRIAHGALAARRPAIGAEFIRSVPRDCCGRVRRGVGARCPEPRGASDGHRSSGLPDHGIWTSSNRRRGDAPDAPTRRCGSSPPSRVVLAGGPSFKGRPPTRTPPS